MSSREKNMLIVLGVAAVAALSFFLLTSGDGEPEETTAPTSITSSPGSAASPPVEEEAQEEQEGAEDALDFLGGRDPFVPLVEEATSGSEAPTDDTTTGETTTGGESTTGDTTTGDTTADETTTGDTTTGDSSSGGTGSEGESSGVGEADVTFTGRPVSLVSISSRESGNVARIEVGGETFTVREGQRFSRYFEILSVSRHCTRLVFGGQLFILCEE